MSGRSGASWWLAAAALLLAVPAAAAAEPAVALRARPASLVLGGDARAVIEIDAGDGAAPWVTASVGRIENLRPVGGGRFEADYLPPREAYPQVAIIAAVTGDRCGFTTIPLSGRGVATARSAPGASVRVTIGDAAFGPVRADWSGEARVPVIAPPGIQYAFHRDRPLDLKVPPTLHVHVATAQAAAPADVEQELHLCIFAVTPTGAPRAGAPMALDVTQGAIVARAEGAPGESVATWRLPAGAPRPATATVSLSDEPGLAFALTIARPVGAPARLAVDATPSRVVAGETATVALRVRVADAAGNAVALAPRLEADFGEVSPPIAAGDAWEARLLIPAELGARRVQLVARASAAEERVGIDVVPAPAPAPAPRLVVPPTAAPDRRLAVAPKVGLATSAGGLRAPDLSAEAAYRSALLGGRLALVLEAGTFVRDRTDEIAAGGGSVEIRGRVRYVPFVTSARWQLALGPRQLAWASAGAGLTLVSSQVSAAGGTVRSEAGLVAVAETAVGWGLRARRAMPFVEARLARHGDPRFEALRGSLTVLTLAVGYRYDAY